MAPDDAGAPTTLYLIRHGRTELNAGGSLRGHIDVALDHIGRAEAAALGELFESVPLVAASTSPLQRAVETGRALLDRHGHIALETDADLIDRDWGPWAGRLECEVTRRFGSKDDAPGIEPADHLTDRAVGALTRLAARGTGGPVLAVSHDAVIHAVLAAVTPGVEDLPQPTGCWNQLLFDGTRWHPHVVGAVPGDGHEPGGAGEESR